MKISIIIPVFNAEKYVEKVILSAIFQSYKEIEIILVNDGSTDGSLNILKKYAKKHKNIKVFSIENSGAGGAREYGVKKATGEYVFFLDSDDYLCDRAIEELVKNTNNGEYDIVKGTVLVKIPGIPVKFRWIKGYNKKQKEKTHFLRNEPPIITTMLIRKSLLDGEKWPKQLMNEDVFMRFKLILNAKKIKTIKSNVYICNIRFNSVTYSTLLNLDVRILDILEIVDLLEKQVKKSKKYREYESFVIERILLEMVLKFSTFITSKELKFFERKIIINGYLNYLNLAFPGWEKKINKKKIKFYYGGRITRFIVENIYMDKKIMNYKTKEQIKKELFSIIKKATNK